MKNIVNRIIAVVLVVSLTVGICYQTDLIAKRIVFAKTTQLLSLATASDGSSLYSDELRDDFQNRGEELQELINAAGMSNDKDFVTSASDLFSSLYTLLKNVVISGGQLEDIDAVEDNFTDIFNGLFALDARLNETNPELMGELTNKGFVCSAISIVWDFMTYYDANRVSKQTMAEGVVRLEDIAYIDDGTNEHMLDIYYPEGTQGDLPVIIDIHGGGLMMGDKDTNKIYCSVLAAKGYTVISVNYRLSPDVLYPSQIQDIMAAFEWVNHNGGQFHCDFDKVYVTGDSAGGQLAYYVPLVDTSEQLQKLYNVSPSGLSIDAVGLVSGMYDMKNGLNGVLLSCFLGFDYKNSPYYPYIQPEDVLDLGTMPPAYVVTSTKDFLHASGVYFDKILTEKGIEHQFHDWPVSINRSSGHITSVAYPELDESQQTIDEMLTFFAEHTK